MLLQDTDLAPLVGAFPDDSRFAEAYRMLRTNLLLSGEDHPPRCIVVTSAERGEGKSITSANLALVMARTERRVALLDADLRMPSQHLLFGVARYSRGLADRYSYPIANNLDLVTPGARRTDPSETIDSVRFQRFLDVLLDSYDTVIVDSPPVGRVTDAALLGTLADAVLLVVDFNGRRRNARRAVQALRRVHAPLVGVVVNRHDREAGGAAFASAYAAT
jgi:polysaccharide biosynthesis transport protein